MSRTIAVRAASFAAVMLLLLINACGDAATLDPVVPKPIATIIVDPNTPSIVVGETMPLRAIAKAADGELLERAITWSSENETIATVSSAGVVTTLAVGYVNVVAASEGKRGHAILTVLPVPPVPVAEVRLSVDDAIELEWNGSTQIGAVALDAQGNVLENRQVLWTTNKPEIATVTQQGAIQAVASGTATITAIIDGVPGSVSVRVKTAPLVEILLDVPTTGLEVGEMVFFGTRLKTANGQVLLGPVSWASSDFAIARVTGTDISYGAVEAVGEGPVTITASRDGVSASVTLRITPKPTHDLIYSRWTGTQASEIFTLSLGTPGATPLRMNAGTVSRDPSPSPDGTQFVFAVSQTDMLGRQQHDLFIVNRDGMNMRWLTRVEGYEDQPQWSPDGTRILYHGTDGDYHNPNIFVINVDGTGIVNLTAGLPADITDKRDPAWSPDGKKIAFIAARGGTHKVWTMNADGSGAAALTTDSGFDMTPTWSHDGSKIAFVRYNSVNPEYRDDIMIVSSAGGAPIRLALPGNQHLPAWSPDGHYIAFSGSEGNTNSVENLYTVRPDGTGLRLRTANPQWGGGIAPAWITRR